MFLDRVQQAAVKLYTHMRECGLETQTVKTVDIVAALENGLRQAYEAGRNDAMGITPMQLANQELCAKGLCVHDDHKKPAQPEKGDAAK